MRAFLRDIALSYCPAAVRKKYGLESGSHLVTAAALTGLAQFLLFAVFLLMDYRHYLALRSQQFGEHVGGSMATQAGAMAFFSLEFLLYPVSIILMYFTLEGLVRFVGGLCVSEVVPTLPVTAWLALDNVFRRRNAIKEHQRLALPDSVEPLENGERLRIACSHPKTSWNASVTIGIDGRCWEVEKQEAGPAPRPYVYYLRPAPVGKALRGYQEYDAQVKNNS